MKGENNLLNEIGYYLFPLLLWLIITKELSKTIKETISKPGELFEFLELFDEF